MTSVMDWINFNRGVYFGNATATRDFRVQLRGNRSALLFGTYLVVLIGVAMFVYSQAVGDQRMSIVEAQGKLQSFYLVVMEMLAGTICLVAPALSSTTVVLERQRRSLDLVFSAPVSPKYYLVGKMLSSYRYIWMMLALSLPVTAACVVLGGASWSDVIGSYALLSTQALILTSLSLLMSTLAPRPVSAVIWSYAICAPYLFFTGVGSASYYYAFGHMHTMQAPFTIALSPFMATQAVGTFSLIGGLEIPNWIPALVVTLLVTKIALLCAGAQLNPIGREARSLRIHGLAYMTVALGFVGYFSRVSITGFSSDSLANLGREFAWTFIPLFIVLPFMACYGFDAENRFKPNGVFKLKDVFSPTPASALPYLFLLLGGSAIGLLTGYAVAGPYVPVEAAKPALDSVNSVDPQGFLGFIAYFALTASLWTFFWATGRLASSFSVGLRAARGLQFAAFLLVCAMPVPLLTTIDHTNAFDHGANIWSLWVLRSMFTTGREATGEAMTYATILVLLTIPISFYAETRLKEVLATRELRKEARRAA